PHKAPRRRPRATQHHECALNVIGCTNWRDTIAGRVTGPDGSEIAGPDVRWTGRRHGRRQDRRWATAWSPEQTARRLPVDFPGDYP
ncbi:hypothetical protein ABT187_50120, partial [Streptomyces sp. NPDC001817]